MKITKARLGALSVLKDGTARYSNQTSIELIAGATVRSVHHEPADWLINNGYARRVQGGEHVEITSLGIKVLHNVATGVA